MVMPLPLLEEVDHVARRKLGSEAAGSAIDDFLCWMRRGGVVMPEATGSRWAPPSRSMSGATSLTWSDDISLGARAGRFAPLLTAVFRS